MNTVKEHLYLAALLHDIGKFYQRADTGSVAGSKHLKPVIKELSSILLPSYNGNSSHKHCLWTAQFIEDYSSVFQQLTASNLNDLTDKDNLINLSAGHHLPVGQQTELGKLLKKADSLSSGMDRDGDDSLKDDQDETGWDSFKKKRMTSILQDINKNRVEKRCHLPLSPIRLDEDYFPNEMDETPDYVSLWADFKKDFNLIQANTYHAFAETLLSLLFKYATTIPASTINFPDVSLYDHLKTTAAIAVCLYDYQQQPKNENPFLLIGGDLSGIQNYICQIISKYAAKNLKGRSFYLRILSDAIVRYILKELHLFQANVIYNSGGSFYILAPNTAEVKDKLDKAVAVIEGNLFKAHGTSLFVAIDSVEVSEDSLMHRGKQSLQKVWEDLFGKRDAKKQAKFAAVIKENYDCFFMPIDGERLHDSITGEEFAKDELSRGKVLDEDDDNKELQLKEITYQQIQLGKSLRDSDLMVVSEEEIPHWRDKAAIAPANLGFRYYLLRTSDIKEMKEQLRASADKISIVSLNGGKELNCDFMRYIDGLNNIYSLEFYGGNIYSRKNFNQMCESDSFSRLGVLRMDVDNLGSLFQSGIEEELATLSRYAALSRSLDYFFSGYLNKIQQDIDAENTFIIYSGGDDVFIVGRWDKTIKIAERIRMDFRTYTCGNPAFSISGGVAIVSYKFPIMKGAEESDIEEKNAKKHRCAESEKNALSFMGTPLNWDKEYPAVKQLMETIKTFTEQGWLPKSFISKVLAHAMNANIEHHTIKEVKTFWMLTYDLSRMKNNSMQPVCKELIDNCIREVCGNKKTLNSNPIVTNYHPLELWAFAARWAELYMRTNN